MPLPMHAAVLSGSSFSIPALFRAYSSAQGFWFDPSDFSTMFQDAAGTTPVTATGQVVGLIRDKSGKGNHASQSNASFKPVLQQDGSGLYYLAFDGTDDFLATAAIDMSASGKSTVFAGLRKNSDAARGIAYEFSADINSNNGAFTLEAPDAIAANTYRPRSKGTAIGAISYGGFVAPITNVTTQINDISAPSTLLRINGVAQTPNATAQGSGNLGNYPFYMGRRGGSSLPANIRLYQLLGLSAAVSATHIAAAEPLVNAKTGAY